jgi:hypothetical protein
MIRIPLSQSGPTDQFAAAVRSYIEACTKHMMGKPGVPAPRSTPLIESLVVRVPQDGPIATRGPDRFIAQPYGIYDDTPVSPEVQMLRDTIGA